MHHDVRLNCPHAALDRRAEFSRTPHPVVGREHRLIPVGSSSQRAATLATPRRHDGASGPGAHPQPEAVHTCPTPIVRLEGPLALSHGRYSSLGLAPRPRHAHTDARQDGTPLVSSCSLTGAVPARTRGSQAVSPLPGDCSRVLTRSRWVKPATRTSGPPSRVYCCHSGHWPAPRSSEQSKNVAELLASRPKTVSFCQCRFALRRRTTTGTGLPDRLRARHRYPVPPSLDPRHDCQTNRTMTSVLSTAVDNFVDRSSSFYFWLMSRINIPGLNKGVLVVDQ